MTPAGLETFTLAPSDGLILDFDGTLVDIGPDPNAIYLAPKEHQTLNRLTEKLDGAVVILSGRDLRDLALRTPDSLWRVGGHGIEVLAPGSSAPNAPPPLPDQVLSPMEALVESTPGVSLEIKGPIAALHFRAAPDAEQASIEAAHKAAALGDNLTVQLGKCVVEVKPVHANKGRAVRVMAGVSPFIGRRLVVAGDDTTDEDAMDAAQALGGIGIKIGEGDSCAQVRARDAAVFREWLAEAAADRP